MRVLVVDDDAIAQRRCRALLEAEGFEVHCESSLGSTRRFLRTQRAAVVLMDLFLPDGCGYELLRVNAELLGDAPVVGMTGVYQGSAAARLLGARYPFAAVLSKPLEPAELFEALRGALGSSYPGRGSWEEAAPDRTMLTPWPGPRGPETWPPETPSTQPAAPESPTLPERRGGRALSSNTFVSPLDALSQSSPIQGEPSAEVFGWDPTPSEETRIIARGEAPYPLDTVRAEISAPSPREDETLDLGALMSAAREDAAPPARAVLRNGLEIGRSRSTLSAPRGVPALRRGEGEGASAVPAAFDPRRAPLQGRLDVTPLPSLLARLARARATGSLLLRRDQIKKIFYLENGIPRAVKSNLLYECLGRMLVREGFLSEALCERSVERLKVERKPQGELLVELGALTQRQMEAALERQFEEKLFDVFGWRQGLYRFRADDLPPGLLRVPPRQPFALILEGVRRAADPERLTLDLSPLMEQRPLLRLPLAEVGAFGLSEAELQWLEQLDGHRSLAELSGRGGDEPLTRLLYALLSLGVLGMEGAVAR
jgi:CheY-like chemotaxis protein